MSVVSHLPNSSAFTSSSSVPAGASGSGASSSLMLSHRLLRVPANQFDEAHAVDLLDLVVHAGEVAHRTTLRPTDTGDGDLVVLVDERDGAVTGTERGDLLPVLDELHPNALPDRGVRLLGFDADLLQYDATPLRGSLEGVGLLAQPPLSPRVLRIGPPALLAVLLEFASGVLAVRHTAEYPTEALKPDLSTRPFALRSVVSLPRSAKARPKAPSNP